MTARAGVPRGVPNRPSSTRAKHELDAPCGQSETGEDWGEHISGASTSKLELGGRVVGHQRNNRSGTENGKACSSHVANSPTGKEPRRYMAPRTQISARLGIDGKLQLDAHFTFPRRGTVPPSADRTQPSAGRARRSCVARRYGRIHGQLSVATWKFGSRARYQAGIVRSLGNATDRDGMKSGQRECTSHARVKIDRVGEEQWRH